MRIGFILTCFIFFTAVYADENLGREWSISKNTVPFSYSVEFSIQAENSLGKVVRSGLFTPHYYYDLYDCNDEFVLRGITRAFSLGLLFPWGMEIDLYGTFELVGRISGEFWSSSRAKFAFYDSKGDIVAHAFLSDESTNFILVSNKNEKNLIAELEGKTCGDASVWKMKSTRDFLEVDERALYIFAAFVADFQKQFIRPPRNVHHYHQNNK